jgi:hypothetical protein
VILHTKYTGWRDNDFNVCAYYQVLCQVEEVEPALVATDAELRTFISDVISGRIEVSYDGDAPQVKFTGEGAGEARIRDANSGGPAGPPAPLASRFHSIPTHFPLHLHAT